MKTKTFILLSLLICNLLPAQNVKLDIKPHFLGVRADSLFVSMDISVEIEDMNPKNAVILTPILTGQDRKILLPAIQLNGKQKQKLYVREFSSSMPVTRYAVLLSLLFFFLRSIWLRTYNFCFCLPFSCMTGKYYYRPYN